MIYIIDPVCASERGHNYAALLSYSRFIRFTLGLECEAIPSRILDSRLVDSFAQSQLAVFPHFHNYYINLIPSPFMDEAHKFIDAASRSCDDTYIEDIAAKDLHALMTAKRISNNDILFYPSIDYFSLKAIERVFRDRQPSAAPSILIRWIGVLEATNFSSKDGLFEVCTDLKSLKHRGFNIKHACESRTYCRHLESLLGEQLTHTPTLSEYDYVPHPNNEIPIISLAGSGRIDKGFNRIPSIVHALDDAFGASNYRLTAQMLPPHELNHHFSVAKEIVSLNRVELLHHVISQSSLVKSMTSADVLIAPYSREVYAMRSSAIMAEAAMLGRYVVASPGCGFSNELSDFKVGQTALSEKDFALAIVNYLSLSIGERENLSILARTAFKDYLCRSYSVFLGAS